MPNQRPPNDWTHHEVSRLARQHFPTRASVLERIVRDLAHKHEAAWRVSSEGTFRPTPAMYALALRWIVDRTGPTCAQCGDRITVPHHDPMAGRPTSSLTLSLRIPADRGGLNVPQNLAMCHAGCTTS